MAAETVMVSFAPPPSRNRPSCARLIHSHCLRHGGEIVRRRRTDRSLSPLSPMYAPASPRSFHPLAAPFGGTSVTATGTLFRPAASPDSASAPTDRRRGVLHERSTLAGTPDFPSSRIAVRSRRRLESARTMRGLTSRDRDPPPRRVPQESFLESSPVRSLRFDRCRGALIRSGESRRLLWVPCGPVLDSCLRAVTPGRTRCPAFPQNAPLRVLQESLSI